MKKFTKNDNSFTCIRCGAIVPPLFVTSRDHCNNCLYSVHVDINPGDRANTCKGVLRPTGVTSGGKKGYVIEYTCEKCGARMRNKAAVDDNFEELLKVSSAQDIIKR